MDLSTDCSDDDSHGFAPATDDLLFSSTAVFSRSIDSPLELRGGGRSGSGGGGGPGFAESLGLGLTDDLFSRSPLGTPVDRSPGTMSPPLSSSGRGRQTLNMNDS